MQSTEVAIVNPSDCPSIRLSHAGTVSLKMTHATIMRSSLDDSPMILVSMHIVNYSGKFQREHRMREG